MELGRPTPGASGPSPVPYEGQVPPGGWHAPVPPTPVPGELSGWWRRVGASVVDGVVISLPATLLAVGVVAILAGPGGGISIDGDGTGVLVGVLTVILSLIGLAAVVFLTALIYAPMTMRRQGAHNGQTWGKQLMRIRVIRIGGEPSTFASAAVREVVVKSLLFGVLGGTLASIPTVLDLLWPLWDDENRALHDMVVDTRVITV